MDRSLVDALKDVHNRGADIYNSGDPAGCYRMFQGCLVTARGALSQRPADQAFIDEALAAAERESTYMRRAFLLHESIDQLRSRLKGDFKVETLELPREMKKADAPPIKTIEPQQVPPADQPKKANEGKDIPKQLLVPPAHGISGRLVWKGQPLHDARIQFVPFTDAGAGAQGRSGADGRFSLEPMPAGRYKVIIVSAQASFPERYSAPAQSPLIVEVKAGGDTVDFILQD